MLMCSFLSLYLHEWGNDTMFDGHIIVASEPIVTEEVVDALYDCYSNKRPNGIDVNYRRTGDQTSLVVSEYSTADPARKKWGNFEIFELNIQGKQTIPGALGVSFVVKPGRDMLEPKNLKRMAEKVTRALAGK